MRRRTEEKERQEKNKNALVFISLPLPAFGTAVGAFSTHSTASTSMHGPIVAYGWLSTNIPHEIGQKKQWRAPRRRLPTNAERFSCSFSIASVGCAFNPQASTRVLPSLSPVEVESKGSKANAQQCFNNQKEKFSGDYRMHGRLSMENREINTYRVARSGSKEALTQGGMWENKSGKREKERKCG